ncbi:MAG: nitroreductase family protein [Caldisericia bacterium]|nr:nitroreductase family protein [Caldisericia bacterium]
MEFDVIAAIHNRISTKLFHNSSLDGSKRKALEKYINTVGSGPFLSKMKFYLIDIVGMSPREIALLGLPREKYHANTYIVGTVLASEEYNLEDYGYIFEKIILYATSLQLGTSWLALRLNRNRLAELIGANDFEMIPCISPIGLPFDYLCQNYISTNYDVLIDSKNRKPKQHLFFESHFSNPIRSNDSNQYQYAMEMVRLAPSIGNKQPWRILYDTISGGYHFYLEHSLHELYLPQYEQVIDLQRVDMGVAMFHFEATLQHFGLEGKWRIMDPNFPLPNKRTEYIATWTL